MFLSFSDSAKFADIARNIVSGTGYGGNFTFWDVDIFALINQTTFPAFSIPPFMPLSIALFFMIFGSTKDYVVIATSIFYFILTLIFVFLLTKRLFTDMPGKLKNLTGILSALAVGFNYDMLHYATGGASESPFVFQIVASLYFSSFKKTWANVITVLLLLAMYFTRYQAFIYIAAVILFWLLTNFKIKKAFLIFVAISVFGFAVDRLILLPLVGKTFFYSITNKGVSISLTQTASGSTSDSLRGVVSVLSVGPAQVARHIFYNLYNFYKLLPQIINPYLFTLFIIGIFLKTRDRMQNTFKVAAVFMVLMTFFVTATSIPFFRYLHPVIPVVYIAAVGTLVSLMSNVSKKLNVVMFISSFLVLLFAVGQTVGVYVLDSRFEKNIYNTDKPPVYVELSKILKENTSKDGVVVTNLDTWGTWHGERRTVWFPVEPLQIVDTSTGKIPFDAIYLTGYLMDDQNYYMGPEWRMIFENPDKPINWTCGGCSEIAEEFILKGVYDVKPEDNYQKLGVKSVLFVKK
jgi:hypothetical protein